MTLILKRKKMGLFNSGYKCIIWTVLFLCLLELCQVEGLRYGYRYIRSYRSYRTYITYTYYYYYYYSYSLSTGAIVGIVFGALIGGAIFFTGCILCCVCCCCPNNKSTNGQVIQQGQPQTVSTISTSSMTTSSSTHEPGVYFNPSTFPNQQQYNTEYSAPPPSYGEVTSTGSVNTGFKS